MGGQLPQGGKQRGIASFFTKSSATAAKKDSVPEKEGGLAKKDADAPPLDQQKPASEPTRASSATEGDTAAASNGAPNGSAEQQPAPSLSPPPAKPASKLKRLRKARSPKSEKRTAAAAQLDSDLEEDAIEDAVPANGAGPGMLF